MGRLSTQSAASYIGVGLGAPTDSRQLLDSIESMANAVTMDSRLHCALVVVNSRVRPTRVWHTLEYVLIGYDVL